VSTESKIKNFEKNLGTLEKLVEALESGDLSLEQSLNQFEKGVKMTRECQAALEAAEQRVQMLVEQNGENKLVDFDETQNTD
jgi:exodeoxyribonuclease VII small subunit